MKDGLNEIYNLVELKRPLTQAVQGSIINLQSMPLTQDYRNKIIYNMSAKAGVNIPIAGFVGFCSQEQYNYSPGNGGRVNVKFQGAKGRTTLTTEPISKYFNIDTGFYLMIGNVKKIF